MALFDVDGWVVVEVILISSLCRVGGVWASQESVLSLKRAAASELWASCRCEPGLFPPVLFAGRVEHGLRTANPHAAALWVQDRPGMAGKAAAKLLLCFPKFLWLKGGGKRFLATSFNG